MDRPRTPDPGSTETAQPDDARDRNRNDQNPIPENEGLSKQKTREAAPGIEEAAQRGRAP